MRRVALVTGAARGIGAATVAHLVADGYRVVAVDSCEGPPLATQNELDSVAATHGDRVLAVVADVRNRVALVEAADLAVTTWGRLDSVPSSTLLRLAHHFGDPGVAVVGPRVRGPLCAAPVV